MPLPSLTPFNGRFMKQVWKMGRVLLIVRFMEHLCFPLYSKPGLVKLYFLK